MSLTYTRSLSISIIALLIVTSYFVFTFNIVMAQSDNQPPVADVGGPYSGTEGLPISFDGSGSYDPDGTIVSWFWDFGDGESSADPNPTHAYAQDGIYSVSLNVTDDGDATAEDTASVVVADVDPVADFSASPTSGNTPLSVTFSDLTTSYDGVISWSWIFGDGTTSTETNPSHVYGEGTYSVSLTVEELDGDTDTETKTGYITATALPNQPPVADVGGPYSGTEGLPISFDGSGSYDPDGTIVSWFWDFGDGESSADPNPTHAYAQDGIYSVSLNVTDDGDATAEDTASVVVADVDPVADFSASPTSGNTPLSVTFSDLTTSYDGVISWSWIFGDGTTSTETNPSHVYGEGTYSVSLTVEELDGDTDTETKTGHITVTVYKPPPPPNSSPIADFDLQSSAKPTINETISFIDQSIDTDGTVSSWSWNFGDGYASTTQNPTHKYQSIGTYTVTLTVKDDDGASGTKTKQITIYEVNPPVTTDDYDGLWYNSDFTITLTATDDYNGVSETYYMINDGPTQQLSMDGQPRITTEGANNTLEYWSIDNFGNEEIHHTILDIKLDKTGPTADAGQDITVAEDTIMNFDGSNSNDNIQITNYKWTLLDGALQTLTGVNPQYIFHTPGVYAANLTVTDAALNSAFDAIIIIVIDITDPVANAGDDHVVHEGNIVTFDGSVSTDNVEIVSYNWKFIDVTPQTLVGANPTYTFESTGVYEVTLTVSDVHGNSGTDVVSVTVIDSTWPAADAGPDQIVVEDTWVYFDGSASSDNVGIISYIWTLTDGKLQTLYGVNASYFFEMPDVYVITLAVSDAEGHSSNDTVMIIVRDNTAPTIEVDDYATAIEDNPINFDASRSYDNAGIVNFQWVFGDGTVENTAVPAVMHIYSEPGVYNVELIITDITGNVNSTIISIVVYRDTDGDLIADYLDTDDDGDGIPDEWEILHELDPLDASDATLDSDGDGISNIEEYQRESDPKVYDFPDYTLSIVLVVAVIIFMISFGIFYTRKLQK
jgi:PKD repeat protein